MNNKATTDARLAHNEWRIIIALERALDSLLSLYPQPVDNSVDRLVW